MLAGPAESMPPGYTLPQEAGLYSSLCHQRSLPARGGVSHSSAATFEKQTSSSWALAAASTDCSGSNASDVGVDADTMHLQSVWDVLPSSDDEDEPILRNDARAARASYAGKQVDQVSSSAAPPTMIAPSWLSSVPPPPQQPPSGLNSRAMQAQAPAVNGNQMQWVNAVPARPNQLGGVTAPAAHQPVLASSPPAASSMGVVPYGPMKSSAAAPSPPACAPPDLPLAGVPQPPKAPPQGLPAAVDEALPRAPQWQFMDQRQPSQGAWMMSQSQQAMQYQQQMLPHALMSQQRPPQQAVPPSHPPPPEPPVLAPQAAAPGQQRSRQQKSQGKSAQPPQPHQQQQHFGGGEQLSEEDDGTDGRQSSGNQADKFRCEFVKTRLCRFELMGCCQKGTSCPFAHGVQDLRTYPDLTKTSICHKWARGCCPLPADRCRYAHGASDRRMPEFTRTSQLSNSAGANGPGHHS